MLSEFALDSEASSAVAGDRMMNIRFWRTQARSRGKVLTVRAGHAQ